MDRRELIILDTTYLTTDDSVEKYVGPVVAEAERIHVTSNQTKLYHVYGNGNFSNVRLLTHCNPLHSPILLPLNSFKNKSNTGLWWMYRHGGLITQDMLADNKEAAKKAGWMFMERLYGFPDRDSFHRPFLFIWTNPLDPVERAKQVRAEAMRTGRKMNIEE